jgi:NADH:ubiquinone oxidoreductase subunit 3 (subunit A)
MKKNELLLYQANSIPSALAMLFLVFNTVQIIFTLNTVDIAAAGIRVMEIILLNIFLSFLVFIAASEMKRYNMRWSLASLGIGIFQCLRYFFIPAASDTTHTYIAVPLMLAGIFLIAASVMSLVQCGRYRTAKKELECHT